MATTQSDPFNLVRFERAQEGSYEDARAEIAAGHKTSHWMWFVFPQIRGLGSSETARFYAIASADEARAYLSHPTLGGRLRECVSLLNSLVPRGLSAERIFGGLDAVKLRSCLTLFDAVAPEDTVFAKALDRYFGGQRDQRTLDILARRESR